MHPWVMQVLLQLACAFVVPYQMGMILGFSVKPLSSLRDHEYQGYSHSR